VSLKVKLFRTGHKCLVLNRNEEDTVYRKTQIVRALKEEEKDRRHLQRIREQ